MLGMVKRGVAEQGANRRKPGVSRPRAVAALPLEMIEELADKLGIDVGEIELGWLPARPPLRECQQQLERVAIGGNGLRACVPLAHEPVGEERLQGRGECGHE
jgi:hypothetical protein